MSSTAVSALEKLGTIRRQMNLVAVKMLRPLGLHPKQMIMLRFVHERGEVTLTELARGTATDMAAASRAIGPLAKNGWLQKMRDAADGRCWKIRLTPRAKRKMFHVDRIYAELAERMTAPLNPKQRVQVVRLLDTMMSVLAASLEN